MPNTAAAPAVETPSVIKVTTGIMIAKKGCNLFVAGQPLRDENGSLITDPNRIELVLEVDGKVESHRVRTANLEGKFRYGATCHLLWSKLPNYNNGEEFVDAVMID